MKRHSRAGGNPDINIEQSKQKYNVQGHPIENTIKNTKIFHTSYWALSDHQPTTILRPEYKHDSHTPI